MSMSRYADETPPDIILEAPELSRSDEADLRHCRHWGRMRQLWSPSSSSCR